MSGAPASLCTARLDHALLVTQARASNGGFFQDNRQLDIVKVYADRYGPSTWAEE